MASGDGDAEMAAMALDDETIEAIVRGEPVEGRVAAALATVARGIEAAGDGPLPAPSAELRLLLAVGPPGAAAPADGPPVDTTSIEVAAVAGVAPDATVVDLAARLAVAAGVAAVGTVALTGAGAAGVLPTPVRSVVDFVSPVDLPAPADEAPTDADDPPVAPAADGATTSPAGSPTVPLGGAAPGGDPSPAPSAGPSPAADQGLARAGETPAAPHLPTTTAAPGTSVPGGSPSATAPGATVTTPVPETPPVPTTAPSAPAVTRPTPSTPALPAAAEAGADARTTGRGTAADRP